MAGKFKPVTLEKGDRTVVANTAANAVKYRFDGFTEAKAPVADAPKAPADKPTAPKTAGTNPS